MNLHYADGNLLFDKRGRAAAIYRLDPASYALMTARLKADWQARLSSYAFAAEADFSLHRVCRLLPGGSFMPEVYLVVNLDADRSSGPLELLDGMLGRLVAFGRAPRLTGKLLDGYVKAEEHAYSRARAWLPVKRATTRELQWLLNRAATRGLSEPELDPHWAPSAIDVRTADGSVEFRPTGTDMLELTTAPLVEHADAVQLGENVWQAFLTMGMLPPAGGAELLFGALEACRWPVDLVMHVRWIENEDAIVRVRRKVIDNNSNFNDQLGSTHGPLDAVASKNTALARELGELLTGSSQPPLLHSWISLAVTAPDRDTLGHRVDDVRRRFAGVKLRRPAGLQRRLYADQLPRVGGAGVKDYTRVLTTDQFGALVPHGTHYVGSTGGARLGRVLNGAGLPVHFDPTEASRSHRPPTVFLHGSLGSGKTLTAEQMIVQATRIGSRSIVIDPKADWALDRVAELEGRIRVIDLAPDERFRGMLDPLVVAQESERFDLTVSFLIGLVPGMPEEWKTAVYRAVRDVLDSTGVKSCTAVLERLAELCPGVADALEARSKSGMAMLAFGDGTHHLQGSDAQVTVIRARPLNLPTPGTEATESERTSVAILGLLTAFALRHMHQHRSAHKLVAVNEAWALLAGASGVRLLDRLARLSRSENTTLVLLSQTVGDAGRVADLIGTVMILGQDSAEEARRGLSLLRLDPDDAGMVDRLLAMRTGRALMKDIHGRVGEIQVEVEPGLLGVLDTSPPVEVAA